MTRIGSYFSASTSPRWPPLHPPTAGTVPPTDRHTNERARMRLKESYRQSHISTCLLVYFHLSFPPFRRGLSLAHPWPAHSPSDGVVVKCSRQVSSQTFCAAPDQSAKSGGSCVGTLSGRRGLVSIAASDRCIVTCRPNPETRG